jgi:hypothetical protein
MNLPDLSTLYPPNPQSTPWMNAGPAFSGWAASDVANAAPPPQTPPTPTDPWAKVPDWYKYATLASMLGTVGSAAGMAFRPWFPPPPPVSASPYKAPETTAPASLQYLASAKQKKG